MEASPYCLAVEQTAIDMMLGARPMTGSDLWYEGILKEWLLASNCSNKHYRHMPMGGAVQKNFSECSS